MMDYNAPPNNCTFGKAQKELGPRLGLSNQPYWGMEAFFNVTLNRSKTGLGDGNFQNEMIL